MTPSPLKGKDKTRFEESHDGTGCDDAYSCHDDYDIKSALEWITETFENEIDKAIRDYRRMKFNSKEEELIVEKLLIMYIETTYGCIQTVEAGLEDVI